MKKLSIISTLSLLALLAGCGCCKKRTCTKTICEEQVYEKPVCKEDVCEVAHVTAQNKRVSGTHTSSIKWEKEDLA